MAAINVVLNGVFTTDAGAATGSFVGQMAYSDRAPGGGPILPPEGGGGSPPGIWPNPPEGIAPHPEHPIAGIPGYPGYRPPGSIWPGVPTHPIVLPPEQVPPEQRPPEVPPPGTVTPVPPPAGSGGWPVSGMVAPPYVVMNYPGYGPVVVTPPPHAEPA